MIKASTIPLLLASRSPRRSKILDFIGIPFKQVRSRGVVEKRLPGEKPSQMVRRLAVEKAVSVSRRFPNAVVLGADTIVVSEDRVFGKPASKSEAEQTLKRLGGKAHFVLTGVALVEYGGKKIQSHVDRTRVFFRRITKRETDVYLRSKEPYDKAGAYDIQGRAGLWVKKWEGDYFNVMGLPVQWVVEKVNAIRNQRPLSR